MKRFIFVLLILAGLTALAQEMSVGSFQASTYDLSAATYSRLDLNGTPCALVKVQAPIKGLAFEGNIVGDVEFNNGEYWVYLTDGSTKLKIMHESLYPLAINLKDFNINGVASKRTYTLALNLPPMPTDSKSQVQSEYVPSEQDLFINDFVKSLAQSYNIDLGTTTISEAETILNKKSQTIKFWDVAGIETSDKTKHMDIYQNNKISMMILDAKNNNMREKTALPKGIYWNSSYKEWNDWFVRNGLKSTEYKPKYGRIITIAHNSPLYMILLTFDGKETKLNTLNTITIQKFDTQTGN